MLISYPDLTYSNISPMKIESPPPADSDGELLKDIAKGKFKDFLNSAENRYLYWDEVKHRKVIPYQDPFRAWQLLKLSRRLKYEHLEIADRQFCFYQTNQIQRDLHEFDLKLIGGLYENPVTLAESLEYLGNSLNEEAIASSQIEGAATTTKVAWQMLKTGRLPRNESEQMIFNNLRAIQYIEGVSDHELDFGLIIELHNIMTRNTKAEDSSGAYRKGPVYVTDHVDGEIAHIPPDAGDIESLMMAVCKFANQDDPFIHPIVKASIIHFLIAWIHPFTDGNGRTARSLYYWYLFKKGYTLIRNISISRVILESRIQYDRAFLKTEADDLDLNYFIVYSMKSLKIAFENLIRYRDRKKGQRELRESIATVLREKGLNKRQADLIGYLYLKHPLMVNITSYAEQHGIVRQTAKADLEELRQSGYLVSEKSGRNLMYKLASKEAIKRMLDRQA